MIPTPASCSSPEKEYNLTGGGVAMGKATRLPSGYFFGNIRTFVATGLFLFAVTIPFTLAQNTSHKVSHSSTSSSRHATKAGASVGCTNHGLPCSSAPAPSAPAASGTQGSQYGRQLSQIEHEKVTTPKSGSSTRSASTTPSHSVSHTSAKSAPPINFSYHAPHSTAATSTKSH